MDDVTKARAATLWEQMDKNERAGVRFGLFPADKMEAVELEGFNSREVCIALMDVAKKNGGMIA